MQEMKYRVEEFDIDLLFPLEVVLTIDDLITGLHFVYGSDEENDRRVEGYFRSFIQDIGDGKIGRKRTGNNFANTFQHCLLASPMIDIREQ
jgi:hypothetical protein